MRWIRRTLAVGAAVVLLGLAVRARYRRWIARVTRLASAESSMADTALGPVEYDDRGSGPGVLHFHGGNVGHNGWFFLAHLVEAGHRLLTPDRPGYLGTPIENGGSPEQHADLAAALLDELGIERVAAVGISAGGPAAIQFAARYPDRVSALVLLSAISQQTGLTDDQTGSALGRLVMTPRYQNAAYYLINRAMHLMTAAAMRDLVRTETTYDARAGDQLIEQVLSDPAQKQQVLAMADAMVPALPRFAGVMNDLDVQRRLEPLPFGDIQAPTSSAAGSTATSGTRTRRTPTNASQVRSWSRSISSGTSSGGATPT